MDKKNKHLGSNLDDFLREEGLLEEVTRAATERVRKAKKDLRALRGKIKFCEGYDYKALRKR